MKKFVRHTGIAAPMPMMNIDTDKIIPKQFLKTTQRTGLGHALFYEIRFLQDGKENPTFILNKEGWRNASLLIAGANFGCGSSREHAPWALLDYGIQCVLAPSFADIFYNNSFKNGLLPLVLPAPEIERLLETAQRAPLSLTVDLEACKVIEPSGKVIPFTIDAFRRDCLLKGLDEIGLTERHNDQIQAFETDRHHQQPWA